jgi:uncharacterized protein
VRPSRLGRVLAVALVAIVAAGCGTSAPARFYTLDATAAHDGVPLAHATVLVEPVAIPAAVDRPQFVVQVAPNRVEVDEFNRWVAPLGDSIARVVARDLTVLLGSSADVTTQPVANVKPDYRVTIDVERFESNMGEAALIDAVWTVNRTAGRETHSGRTVAREPVQGDSFDALAAAHSRALARISSDIAAAIRGEAEDQP